MTKTIYGLVVGEPVIVFDKATFKLHDGIVSEYTVREGTGLFSGISQINVNIKGFIDPLQICVGKNSKEIRLITDNYSFFLDYDEAVQYRENQIDLTIDDTVNVFEKSIKKGSKLFGEKYINLLEKIENSLKKLKNE